MPDSRWDARFLGRDQELRDLIRAWDKAKTKHPQLVLLLGDSGYGKTRLVQEFYNWLSLHQDEVEPDGYWPDLLGKDGNSLNVNPSFCGYQGQGEIPWLWWGLRWQDRDRNKMPSSLIDFIPELMPHVQTILRRRKISALAQKTGALLLGWITGGISEVTKAAWDVYKDSSDVIDQVKTAQNIIQSGQFSSYSIIERERAKPGEICQDFLTALLNDQGKNSFPVILVLDDTQWVDKVSLAMLKQLFGQAVRSNWPLLIIATHWEHLWHDNLKKAKAMPPKPTDAIPDSFAELILDFQKQNILKNWTPKLMEKLPIEFMRELTRVALSGLTANQIDQIVVKVDGNPIYLGDVIAYLKNSTRNFLDRDPMQPLSNRGENTLKETLTTDHMWLIRNRFESLNEDLRILLAQASCQGIRFIDELTVEVALMRGEFSDLDTPRLKLKTAAHPETITNQVAEQSYEFRQRSFYEIAREMLKLEDLKAYSRAMMSVIMEWYQQGRFEQFERSDRFNIYHWMVDHRALIDDQFVSLALVYLELAEQAHEQFNFADAEQWYRNALEDSINHVGVEHLNVAIILNNLSELYHNQGRYEEAESHYLRALAICEKVQGPEHPDVATCLNNLGELYRDQGRYEEAEPHYLRALAIREKVLGPEHPDVAQSLNNLGLLYDIQRCYKKAESHFQRALAIRKKALGPEHPDVSQSLNNLALLYHSQGRYEEGEPPCLRALAICEKVQGPEHPNVAKCLNNLGALYHSQGRYEEAEPHYLRALAICEKVQGPEHPNVATCLNNLGELYLAQGHYEEAELYYLRALAICEKALRPEHLDVATCLISLARLYHSQGRYKEAESYFQRVQAIWGKGRGPKHIYTLYKENIEKKT